MINKTFYCIDAHTCGNPVRLVAGGGPILKGSTMFEKRQHFLNEFDWIRKGLMFEPRGHDIMSGSILYPPCDPENDVAILFIETSGCLPMCGHGTIGTVTIMIEKQLITPKVAGHLRLETPAGLIKAEYKMNGQKVESVKITNVPSFLYKENLSVNVPYLGEIFMDVAYGGNFYAIVDKQENYQGLEHFSSSKIIQYSPIIRKLMNEKYEFIHPENNEISGLSHLLWTGEATKANSTARNAVFYGFRGIDRSPCGTGTSSRMAQWAAKGKLKKGETFVHESIIGSQFIGEIVDYTKVAEYDAIIPSIEGWAKITGHNTITIDEDDPFAFGFSLD